MVSAQSIASQIRAIPEKKEKLRRAYEDLRSLSSTLSSFTLTWSDLEEYLTSVQSSIDARFLQLQSKEKSLSPPSKSPTSQLESDPREELKLFCVNMDGIGLRSFINDNRKDLANLRTEIAPALRLALDPARLIMDAMVDFYPFNPANKGAKEPELHANRRTCILLLEKLNDISPNISDQVRDTASKTALEWKQKISDVAENSVEGWAFLQLLATYKLTNEFDMDGIMDIIIPIARRKPTIDVCREMGIDDKIPGLIEKLNSKGKHLDAVKFANAFDLMGKFPPVPLLKEYLKASKDAAQEVRKKGNNSAQARNEATAKEISAYKAVIKAIEEYKLETEYPSENLKKQVTRLEQMKFEKKRSATTSNSSAKSQQLVHVQKRPRPDIGAAVSVGSAYPLGSFNQPQLSLGDRASYLSSIGQYGLTGPGSIYDHGPSGLHGAPVPNRSPSKSYLYPSESHLASLYDRPTAYDSRAVSYGYDSRQVGYDSRPGAYDTMGGAYDNRAASAGYDNRTSAASAVYENMAAGTAASYGSYNLSSALPPQYSNSHLQ